MGSVTWRDIITREDTRPCLVPGSSGEDAEHICGTKQALRCVDDVRRASDSVRSHLCEQTRGLVKAPSSKLKNLSHHPGQFPSNYILSPTHFLPARVHHHNSTRICNHTQHTCNVVTIEPNATRRSDRSTPPPLVEASLVRKRRKCRTPIISRTLQSSCENRHTRCQRYQTMVLRACPKTVSPFYTPQGQFSRSIRSC